MALSSLYGDENSTDICVYVQARSHGTKVSCRFCLCSSEMFVQAVRSCAVDFIRSISSLFLKVVSGNNLFINLALVISLFDVVRIVSRRLPLKFFSDILR